jgi:hypothetical protein
MSAKVAKKAVVRKGSKKKGHEKPRAKPAKALKIAGAGIDAESVSFPIKGHLQLAYKEAGIVRVKSRKELKRLDQIMDLPGQRTWLRFHMRRILKTSLHDDATAEYPEDQAWRYCDLFTQLWGWLKKIAEDAENPNTRSHAGRALGEIIHEVGTREGKRWQNALAGVNDAFKHSLQPFGKGGGKKPKPDLVRWITSKMSVWEGHWLKALKVSRRMDTGRFTTLKEAWQDYFNNLPDALSNVERELSDHDFTKLSYSVLSDFEKLWKSALGRLCRNKWEQEKKAGTLRVKGDISFMKRFGGDDGKEAGCYLAEMHFDRFWMPKLRSQIKTDRVMRGYWNKRKHEIAEKRGDRLFGNAEIDSLGSTNS